MIRLIIYRSQPIVGDNPVSSHTTHSASDTLTPGRIIPTHGEHQQQQRIAAADPIINDNDESRLTNDDDDDIIEQRNNSKPTSV